jgi:hypothetical protein
LDRSELCVTITVHEFIQTTVYCGSHQALICHLFTSPLIMASNCRCSLSSGLLNYPLVPSHSNSWPTPTQPLHSQEDSFKTRLLALAVKPLVDCTGNIVPHCCITWLMQKKNSSVALNDHCPVIIAEMGDYGLKPQ